MAPTTTSSLLKFQILTQLRDNITLSLGCVPELFVLHRGHHFDDTDWYKSVASPELPQIEYNSESIDPWIKQYSLLSKCNKPGKSYVVDGSALEAAYTLL